MGKLVIYYNNHRDSLFGDVLKVKIDENITTEIKKNEIYEVELENGQHNIKMYFEGTSKEQLLGYIDENIEVQEQTYYTYTAPALTNGKGKLEKNNFTSIDEFKKYVQKNNKKYVILGILLFIFLVLFVFLMK